MKFENRNLKIRVLKMSDLTPCQIEFKEWYDLFRDIHSSLGRDVLFGIFASGWDRAASRATSNLERQISEIACSIAKDYYNIESCSATEQLYAVEQSYKGLRLVLEDWKQLTQILREKLGMSAEEVVELWKEIKK